MAQVIGLRTTNQSITETRLVRQVDEEMVMLDPNEAPLVTFLVKAGKFEGVKSPRIEWFEDDFVARWAVNSAATVNAHADSTTITLGDGTLVVKGDILLVPQLATVATAPEMMRVVEVTGNVATVVRNVGGAGLATIDAGAALAILGMAHEEGDTPVNAKTTAPTQKTSYTQIFKATINLTKTQLQSETYASGGKERKRLQNKKMREVKIAMNRQFLFGRASESLTGGPNGNPVRTTMGLDSVISTNVMSAGGLLTRKAVETFARMAFRYGSGEKLLIASPMIASAFATWAKAHQQLAPGKTEWGSRVTRIITGQGDWILVRDWSLEDGVAGKNGFAGWAYSVDFDNIEPVFLRNRNLTLSENVIKDGRDAEVDEIVGEVGLKIKQEKTHAKLYNATDYED